MNKTNREILDASLRERVPDDLNLFPRIAAQLQKEKQPMQPRMKLALAFVLIVAVFTMIFSAPGVVSAMRRIIQFIPGFGTVDQGATIRVLVEPVSQTRDGVTVTVTSVILTADRTLLAYSMDNLPPYKGDLATLGNQAGCRANASLRLPDGTELHFVDGERRDAKARFIYDPIPANVDHAIVILPCLMDVAPGDAPENWELPIRFMPAPPEMTVIPVVELATANPSPTVDTTLTLSTPNPIETETPRMEIVVEKALQLPEKLILIGAYIPHPTGASIQQNGDMKITDATGREISYEIPTEALEMPTHDDYNIIPWTAQISSAGLAYPLTFIYHGDCISEPDPQATVSFELDLDQPSENINREFMLAGHPIKLVSVLVSGNAPYYYSFQFETDPDVVALSVDIPDYPSVGGGGGGNDEGSIGLSLSFDKLLSGKVRVVLSHLNVITGSGTWQMQWSPEVP